MKILLVDDRRENLLSLESLLRDTKVEFYAASSGVEALELLLKHDFALAMIDVQMPDMDGLELAEFMRGAEETRSVPIIFVTAGARDQMSTFRGYEKGVVDYLYKPLDPLIVKSKVHVFLELARQRNLIKLQLQETRRALIERDEALKQANDDLKTRDEFISIASHELKTPSTSLHLQVQMILRFLQRDLPKIFPEGATSDAHTAIIGKLTHSAQICERQSLKLSALVDELLDLTRIRVGMLTLSRESVNLGQIVQEVLAQFKNEIEGKGYKIDLDIRAPITGQWDLSRIEQVVRNLISNAIKYGETRPIQILIELDAAQNSARLTAKDQGMGISAEMQEKIFMRFERAVNGNNISGLGLGLYITRQIVEAHGGSIVVQSQVGQGSTFVVTLPLSFTSP